MIFITDIISSDIAHTKEKQGFFSLYTFLQCEFVFFVTKISTRKIKLQGETISPRKQNDCIDVISVKFIFTNENTSKYINHNMNTSLGFNFIAGSNKHLKKIK